MNKTIPFIILGLIMLALTIMSATATTLLNITGTTDAYWNSGVSNGDVAFRIAQGFQLSNSSNITGTDIYFGSKVGTGCNGYYWVELQTDNTGLPSNTTIGITQKISRDSIPNTSNQNFNFTSTTQTFANTTYWLVINHNETATGCVEYIGYCSGGRYADGTMAYSYPDWTWVAYGDDLGVILYGELTNATSNETNETNETFPAFNETTDIILSTDFTGGNV